MIVYCTSTAGAWSPPSASQTAWSSTPSAGRPQHGLDRRDRLAEIAARIGIDRAGRGAGAVEQHLHLQDERVGALHRREHLSTKTAPFTSSGVRLSRVRSRRLVPRPAVRRGRGSTPTAGAAAAAGGAVPRPARARERSVGGV